MRESPLNKKPVEAFVFVDGQVLPHSRGMVSVRDRGFLYGDGILETLRAYNAVPFLLEAHAERMWDSAVALSLPMPPGASELRGAIEELLRLNTLNEAYIRITWTRGEQRAGLEAEPSGRGTLVIEVSDLSEDPASKFGILAIAEMPKSGTVRNRVTPPDARDFHPARGGGHRNRCHGQRRNEPCPRSLCNTTAPGGGGAPGWSLVVYPGRRSSSAFIHRHKTLNQLENVVAIGWAREHDADETLFLDEMGRVLEGTRTNVFAVKAGRLITPSLDLNILPGITRGVIIRLASELGIEVEERAFGVESLEGSDEVFLTNSVREIVHVCRFNGQGIGESKGMGVTESLTMRYREEVRRMCRVR